MAKNKSIYVCLSCGDDFPKWQGCCPSCGEWNTLVEGEKSAQNSLKTGKPATLIPLNAAELTEHARLKSGINEFDLVCGNGLVPGSVILIGGEPGIGKSTLALQLAVKFKTIYFSGEESPSQIRHRATRLGINNNTIHLSPTTLVEDIQQLIGEHKPELVIIDSVQTLYSINCPGLVGSVSQIKEATARLIESAKSLNIPIIIIGHITKEGSIAGPKVLEHLVDTVLYFEGDFSREYRLLRSFKNRFGSVNEIGLFRMSEKGLEEVVDKNSLFLNPFHQQTPGSTVSSAIEGSRTILFEVQSLVSFSAFPNPRRMGDGIDFNRLLIITAVLEKHGNLKLNTFDIFINLAGGFTINETAADLAVALAIASSFKNIPVSNGIAALGEISLAGDIRPVSQCERRLQELERGGFRHVILSRKDAESITDKKLKIELIPVTTISEALRAAFSK